MPLTGRGRKVAAAAAGSALIAGGVAAVVPADAQKGRAVPRAASALLRDADGDEVGRVNFRYVRRTIRVSYNVRGLSPGFHGFHVHATGRCDPKTTDPKSG